MLSIDLTKVGDEKRVFSIWFVGQGQTGGIHYTIT